MELLEKKPFPANLFDFKSYDGMKTLVAFILLLTIFYFIAGMVSLFFWEDSWFRPDNIYKLGVFSFRLFVLVSVYCIAWLTFDKRSLEGYAFSIFSFIFGIVYIITPFDFIPDVVPGISAIDDAIVGGGSILAAALAFRKTSDRKQNTDNVLMLLKNGKETEALKILLNERGLTTVED